MIFRQNSHWITAPENVVPAPLFIKSFTINKPINRALCKISGIGCYVLTLDGSRVDDFLLNPRFSNYDQTVYYNSFELDLTKTAVHTIGICLGRGRHSMLTENTWGWHKPFWDTVRKFILQLEIYYADGTEEVIQSDDSWLYHESPIRFDCLYVGEIYDANYELYGWDTPGTIQTGWKNAVITTPPKGELKLQTSPPIKPIRIIKPQSLIKTLTGSLLYSFDENIAGNVKITAKGQKGESMIIRYGEKIFDNLTVNNDYCNIKGAIQNDIYIFASDETITYEPSFSYKGYQYVEIICKYNIEILNITGIVYHNEVVVTGAFSCSSQLLNKIHDNCKRAILSNMHHVVTDTPIYEKNGWTGDAQLTSQMAMYNFNIDLLYEAWLVDFSDAQMKNGELPPIVPSPGWGYTSSDFGWEAAKPALPIWDFAYFELTRNLYIFYGNKQVITNHYDNLAKYLEYLSSCAVGYIVKTGLGDWLAPVGEDKSEDRLQPFEHHLSSTAYFFQMSKLMAEFAFILNKPDDAAEYLSLGEKIKSAFNIRYFNKDRRVYRIDDSLPYRQTPNILALAFDMVPEEHKMSVVKNLVRNITKERNGHLWCGIAGTRYILEVLCDYGFCEEAYKIVSKTTYPSWGYWIEDGATALYEDWELDTRSKNHHMFGSVDSWFFTHLAGIKSDGPGFKNITIKPFFPSGLDSVNASLITANGKIEVSWVRTKENSLRLIIKLPEKTKCTFINSLDESYQHFLTEGINEFVI